MTSLNQRAIAIYKNKGYICDTAESYNSFTKRKKDLFTILDVVAVGNKETIGIQLTSKSNMSARIKKITESDALPYLLSAGWRVVVLGFFKQPNGRWACKEFEF